MLLGISQGVKWYNSSISLGQFETPPGIWAQNVANTNVSNCISSTLHSQRIVVDLCEPESHTFKHADSCKIGIIDQTVLILLPVVKLKAKESSFWGNFCTNCFELFVRGLTLRRGAEFEFRLFAVNLQTQIDSIHVSADSPEASRWGKPQAAIMGK